MMYEYSEHFIMPLSHDEVVHLKGSLFSKMPGDEWQKLANLRLLLAYMFTRPGKKLLFMGTELAPWTRVESRRESRLASARRSASRRVLCASSRGSARCTSDEPALWRDDSSWEGFGWIDVADARTR